MQTTSGHLFNTSPLQAAPSNELFNLQEMPFPQVLGDTPWNLITASDGKEEEGGRSVSK